MTCQAEVFDTCKDLVQSAIDGYNAKSLDLPYFPLAPEERIQDTVVLTLQPQIGCAEVAMFAYGQTGAGKPCARALASRAGIRKPRTYTMYGSELSQET